MARYLDAFLAELAESEPEKHTRGSLPKLTKAPLATPERTGDDLTELTKGSELTNAELEKGPEVELTELTEVANDNGGEVLSAPSELTKLSKGRRAPSVSSVSSDPLHKISNVAIREVLGFRARWLADVPLPPTLALTVPGYGLPVYIDLRPTPRAGVFDRAEWLAIVGAAELGRVYPAEFRAWVERKLERPRWKLAEDEACGGFVRGKRETLTTRMVLDRIGAELRLVGVDGGEP